MTREPTPTLFATIPRCTRCGSATFKPYKTVNQNDGSKLRYARCKRCQMKVKIIIEISNEIPLSGIAEGDAW